MRRFNIWLRKGQKPLHRLRQITDDTWEVLSRKIILVRDTDQYVGISFKEFGHYKLGDEMSGRILKAITRDDNHRILLTLTER